MAAIFNPAFNTAFNTEPAIPTGPYIFNDAFNYSEFNTIPREVPPVPIVGGGHGKPRKIKPMLVDEDNLVELLMIIGELA